MFGNFNGAVSGMTLEQAAQKIQMAQKTGDLKTEAIHRLISGKIYLETGRFREALYEAGTAMDIFIKAKNIIGQASCHLMLGQAYYSNGAFGDSEKSYNDALALYKKFGDQNGQAVAHLGLAAVYFDNPAKPDIKKVKSHLSEAVVLYQRLGDYNQSQSAKQLLAFCTQLENQGPQGGI